MSSPSAPEPPASREPAGASEPIEIDLSLLVPVFVAEAQEGLARMELALLTLEDQPGDRDALDEVFRAVHTIKGDAATLGMRVLADFAHRVEDALDQLRAGTKQMNAVLATWLLRTVDIIRELVAEIDGGPVRSRDDLEEVLQGLAARLDGGGRDFEDSGAAPARRGTNDASSDLGSGTLRVDVSRLDELLTLAGELAAARSQLLSALEARGASELLELAHASDRLYLDLQELVMKVRMVPVGPVFRRFKRAVRDQAMALGKEALLELEGTDVELDNSVLQRLRDPLSHLLRNALAHGIESPSERIASGKKPAGRIVLRTRREGGGIVVEVSDDGRGLDRAAILERARGLGLVEGSEEPTGHELLQLVFAPGLSTAGAVTDAAGRGVGLDVVNRAVGALRGTAEVTSRPREGTTVTLRLPLTLAVIDGLHVRVADQAFVFALDVVTEALELPQGALASRSSGVLELRDHTLTCVRLSALLGLASPTGQKRQNIVVVRLGHAEVGVVVDEVLGKSQTLIKPLPKILRRSAGFSGLASLGDGGIALVLDVAELLRARRLTVASLSNELREAS